MSPTAIEPYWRDEKNAGLTAAYRRRQHALFLLFAVASLAGLGWGVLSLVRPPTGTRLLPLFVTEYRDPSLVPLPWRAADHDALRASPLLIPGTATGGRLDQAGMVAALAGVKPSNTPLIVYISGLARTAADGGVRILPADADPGVPSTWLPLARVLEALKKTGASRTMLVLDLLPPRRPASRAVVLDDVAAGIARDAEAVPDRNRFVLTACEPGQTAFASETLRRSVFAHYLQDGFRGGADFDRNGRISAREFAAWVRGRVDRWARRVEGARQTPELLGDADDFPLFELPNGRPLEPLSVEPPAAYPPALADAWAKTGGVALREQRLLRLERDWRDGLRPNIDEDVKSALALVPPVFPAGPRPHSLALATEAVGPETVDALRLLAVATEPKTRGLAADKAAAARAQVIDEFLKANKVPAPALSRAALDAVVADARPEVLALMDALLEKLEPDAAHVEVMYLRRLVKAGVDRPTLQRALELVRDSEKAIADYDGFPAVAAELEQLKNLRHDALVILTAPGYAARADAEEPLARAAALLRRVDVLRQASASAVAQLREVRRYLPGLLYRVQRSSKSAKQWSDLADRAAALGAAVADVRVPFAARMDQVAPLTAAVAARLAEAREPFAPDNFESLLRAAKRTSAGPTQLRELEGLADSTLLPPPLHARAVVAARDLAARLEAEVYALDGQDGQNRNDVPPVEKADDAARLHLGAALAVKAAAAAGLDAKRLERAAALVGGSADRNRLAELEGLLRAAWADLPPPPKETGLWAWLADRHRYALREALMLDPEGPEAAFFRKAAREYRPWLTAAREEYASVEAPEVARLLPDKPVSAALEVRASYAPGREVRPRLRLLAPDAEWIGLEPQAVPLPVPASGEAFWPVPVTVRLLPGAGNGKSPQPSGFLAQVRLDDGRGYHRKIDVPLTARRPEILLTASAESAENPLAGLSLRTLPGRQGLFVHVRNPVEKAWAKLAVRLTAGGKPVTSAVFALPPRATRVVPFPPVPVPAPATPPPKDAPPATLPDLAGPVKLELVDTETTAVLTTRDLTPRLADPDDYVAVTNTKFDPRGGLNRLSVSLRLRRKLGGPPVKASLSFPPPEDAGPTYGTNTLAGVVPADLSELVLFADGVTSADGRATFFVSVDGWERAFVFEATLTARDVATPRQILAAELRPRTSKAALAGPLLKVPIEVDNAATDDRLEVSLGRVNAGDFVAESTVTEKTSRRNRIGFSPGSAEGALEFEAALADWVVALETGRRRGPRRLQVRLLSREGGTVRATAEKTLTLDDLPADGVEFVGLPEKAWRAAPLAVRVRADGGLVGIKSVGVFVGAPVEDKVPANVKPVPASPLPADKNVYAATLPLPAAGKGPTEITAVVTNNVGLTSFVTRSVVLEENDPAKTAPGTVKGVVTQGSDPQGDLDVKLYDDKNAEKATTKTKADGSFEFKDVPPGKYRVVTARKPNGRIGVYPRPPALPATLAPGGTLDAPVAMFLP